MMTFVEIIDETVEYYKNNPRGVDELSACLYNVKGKQCAVGRCIDWSDKEFLHEFGKLEAGIEDLVEEFIPHVKLKYADLFTTSEKHIKFWKELQNFHDRSGFWKKTKEGNTLTKMGETKYRALKEKWKKQKQD